MRRKRRFRNGNMGGGKRNYNAVPRGGGCAVLIAVGLLAFTALAFSGCATRAEYQRTDDGFKVDCSAFSSCSAKDVEGNEVSVDGKFDVLKNLFNVGKMSLQ